MSKHTPGPWRVWDGNHILGRPDGIRVGPQDAFQPIEGCGCCYTPWVEGEDDEQRLANARLVVAAPDLLAALKDCLKVMENDLQGLSVIQPEIMSARSAITKAEGA